MNIVTESLINSNARVDAVNTDRDKQMDRQTDGYRNKQLDRPTEESWTPILCYAKAGMTKIGSTYFT